MANFKMSTIISNPTEEEIEDYLINLTRRLNYSFENIDEKNSPYFAKKINELENKIETLEKRVEDLENDV